MNIDKNLGRRAFRLGESMGSMLLERGLLNAEQIQEIQSFAELHGLRFGDAGIRMNLLSQADIDLVLAQQFNYPVLNCGGEGGVDADVVTAYRPQSEAAEALRALRTRLTFGPLSRNDRRVLAITSSDRGEGRSWLAANLATVLAQSGQRTLLIDADIRNPRQHELFGLSNATGITALLAGRPVGDNLIHRINNRMGLYVLPAGSLAPNPQELLVRPTFEIVLTRLIAQFDFIVLDTPAISENADAQIIAARAGAAIMCVRRNHTRQVRLNAAMHSFAQIGANVVGCVMNDF